MGYEYSINYSPKQKLIYDDFLRELPLFSHVQRLEEREPAYIYSHADNAGQLPNALIEITGDGFYFCDYGEGLDVLKEFVFRLALAGAPVEVIDHND